MKYGSKTTKLWQSFWLPSQKKETLHFSCNSTAVSGSKADLDVAKLSTFSSALWQLPSCSQVSVERPFFFSSVSCISLLCVPHPRWGEFSVLPLIAVMWTEQGQGKKKRGKMEQLSGKCLGLFAQPYFGLQSLELTFSVNAFDAFSGKL